MVNLNTIGFGRVPAGSWTRIYSGPRIQPLPLLNFNFRTVPTGSPTTTVSWTIRLYSASVAYNSRSGSSTCSAAPDVLSPELSLVDVPAVWLDVWIFTNLTIDAKCW
jgi:hypothetical protein